MEEPARTTQKKLVLVLDLSPSGCLLVIEFLKLATLLCLWLAFNVKCNDTMAHIGIYIILQLAIGIVLSEGSLSALG